MADFSFLKNPQTGKWVILAPRRSHRTNAEGVAARLCPFCIGNEDIPGEEVYRFPVGGEKHGVDWHIRVIQNKFPFTNHHEVIIHSPDHHKNFDELPFSQVELIFQTYRQRYQYHASEGPHFAKASRGKQVYIFHNRGIAAGESIPHPHSQLAILPRDMQLDIPSLDGRGESESSLLSTLTFWASPKKQKQEVLETDAFTLFCPETSAWPDEVWIIPKRGETTFGEISDSEVTDLAFVFTRVLQLFDMRHGSEFPFNFYISPGKNWYLRVIPRIKILGGFEVGTSVMINTQDPHETFTFLKEHFWEPDHKKIKKEQQADYVRGI